MGTRSYKYTFSNKINIQTAYFGLCYVCTKMITDSRAIIKQEKSTDVEKHLGKWNNFDNFHAQT